MFIVTNAWITSVIFVIALNLSSNCNLIKGVFVVDIDVNGYFSLLKVSIPQMRFFFARK